LLILLYEQIGLRVCSQSCTEDLTDGNLLVSGVIVWHLSWYYISWGWTPCGGSLGFFCSRGCH